MVFRFASKIDHSFLSRPDRPASASIIRNLRRSASLLPVLPRGETWRGFGLIELLAVISILSLMTAAVLPAMKSWPASTGRLGTLNVLMNSFERARLAALATGQTVYVGFASTDPADGDLLRDAFIIFREATEEELSIDASRKYVILQKWTPLPLSLEFARVDDSLIGPNEARGTFAGLAESGNFQSHGETFPFLSFTGGGAISQPSGHALNLHLAERFAANRRRSSFEAPVSIAFSRATGRAHAGSAPLP